MRLAISLPACLSDFCGLPLEWPLHSASPQFCFLPGPHSYLSFGNEMAKSTKKPGVEPAEEHSLHNLIRDEYDSDSLGRVRRWLELHWTHEIRPTAHGLFSASSSQASDSFTGYQNVWIRDCVMIANSFRVRGDTQIAIECARGLTEYFNLHKSRFRDIIEDRTKTLKED